MTVYYFSPNANAGRCCKTMITVTLAIIAVTVAIVCGLVLYIYMYSGLPTQNQPNFCVSEMEMIKEEMKRDLDLYYEPLPQQNLPEINGPFYGRVNELKKLKDEILSNVARIISINGPPAFGKSTMAIKLGHELREYISNVRYIDTESTRSSWFLCISKRFHRNFDFSMRTHVQVNLDMSSGSNNNGLADNDNLCDWFQKLEKRTVLILDNCDHILRSNNRKKFLTIIKNHFNNPFITIILTSQEKLFLLDYGFVSVNIGEFSQEHSRKMLQDYVADLSDQESDELAFAVGHCPLALKVVGKFLSINGRNYVESLLSDLKERVVDTISESMTVEEEKFRAIMDYSYRQMNEQTQKCAHLLSLFPGSTGYGMEEQILSRLINSSCIRDVVRMSFVEEILINKKPRHSMHKLIRDYFKSVYLAYPQSQQFNTSYIRHYSEYLKNVMKRTYADYQISDEELYTIFYLETHNIEYFGSAVVYTDKDNELKANTAIALGLVIQEKFTNTLTQEIFLEAYDSYKNVSVFAKLCSITSQKVCANILWSTVSNLGVPACNAPASHFSDVSLFLTNILSPSLTWFDDGTFCSVLFACDNLHSFMYENTINVIVAKSSERPLYDNIQRGITLCGMHESYIFTGIFILLFLKDFLYHPRETVLSELLPFIIVKLLGYLAITFFTAKFIDYFVQAAINSSFDVCSYSHFELKVSISKFLLLYFSFTVFLPHFLSSTIIEFCSGLFCVLVSLRTSLISPCTFHFVISPLFFLVSLIHNLILLFMPLYIFRLFQRFSSSDQQQLFPDRKIYVLLKVAILLPIFLIILTGALQGLSLCVLFTIDKLNIADVAHTFLSTVSEEQDINTLH